MFAISKVTTNTIDDQSYLTQEIEVDAILFAHWLVKKEFELKTVIPEVIKERILAKLTQLDKKDTAIIKMT